jgi:GABA(A) receptor-associated protein
MYYSSKFKDEHNFNYRLEQATRVLERFPDRIPIICERSANATWNCPNISNRKYLVHKELTLGQFLYIIRKKLKLPIEKAFFLFIKDTIPSSTRRICQLYENYKDDDGHLYITYNLENVFG